MRGSTRRGHVLINVSGLIGVVSVIQIRVSFEIYFRCEAVRRRFACVSGNLDYCRFPPLFRARLVALGSSCLVLSIDTSLELKIDGQFSCVCRDQRGSILRRLKFPCPGVICLGVAGNLAGQSGVSASRSPLG
ncbi:vacuolar amino acid transporter 1-like [Dorcoceras hygrometricum]|uniref:Vacuolar amino acid transporter 1-like n=1 Tax=Dorcoceras hygrometricum TaxID=472368 RepID=A0A2Z7D9E3_9LAMI|nr:vacuolar amino acid transporter 1-like [Dorcoceras hygrometricum]